LKQYSMQAAELENLAQSDPKTAVTRHDWVTALLNVMTIDMATGRYAEATESLGKAQKLLDALMAVDEQDVGLRDLSMTGRLAEVTLARQRGDLAEAARIVDAVLPQLEAFSARAPADRMCTKLLARALRQEAKLQSSNASPMAGRTAARSVELGERLSRAEGASDPEVSECAEDHIVAGEILAKNGSVDEARLEWLRAAGLLVHRMRGSRNWRLLDPSARAAAHLGRLEEARATIGSLNLLGYIPIEPWPDMGPPATAKTPETLQ
jgi:tetratricopeptide (TPR) repeat protein